MDESGSNFLPYEATDINEPSLLPILKEINETAETRTRCLEMLREELKNLEDMEPCLEENFLLSFLRVSKYDTSKALQRIQKYYQSLDVYADALKKCSMPLDKVKNLDYIWISPYRLENNSFLLITPLVDYSKVTFAERFYVDLLAIKKFHENPVNQICGVTFLCDYGAIDIHAVLACTPGWMRLSLDSMTNTLPCRIKAVHIVNMNSFATALYRIIYPFLPKKLKDRIFIHPRNDNWRNLHAFLPVDILPEKYGGKLKQDTLINGLENLEEMAEKFHSSFVFGYTKTKEGRQSLKILH